jgi:hypothetical protein
MGNVAVKEAEYLYFQKSSEAPNQVDLYKIEPEVFLQHLKTFERGDVPAQLSLVKSLPYCDNSISEEAILDKIHGTVHVKAN